MEQLSLVFKGDYDDLNFYLILLHLTAIAVINALYLLLNKYLKYLWKIIQGLNPSLTLIFFPILMSIQWSPVQM